MKEAWSTLFFLFYLLGAFSEENSYSETDDTLYPTNSLISPGAVFPLGGTLPTSRVHHTAVNVLDYVVVYGGYGVDGVRLDDINLFYAVNQRWSGPVFRKQCCNYDQESIETMGFEEGDTLNLPFIRTGFQGDIPLARAEHAATSIDTKMYLFGGVTDDFGYVQDLYSFDVQQLKWHLLTTESNDVPCRRAGHSMTTDGSRYIYVFGGRTSLVSNNRNYGLNDIWRYNVLSNEWTNLYPSINNILTTNKANSNIPPVRQFASLAYINDKIYLFGGINPVSNLTYNDVWMFHPGIKTWTRLFIQNNAETTGWIPPPLYHAHLLPVPLETTYNSNNSEITGFIVYGGVGGGGSCGGSACDQQQTVLGQAFLFEFTHNKWRADHSTTGEANTETIFDTENNYVNATQWSYARMSAFITASQPSTGTVGDLGTVMSDTSGTSAVLSRGSNEGKYVKSYAMEKVVYVQKRKLFYEFGGLQYTGSAATGSSETLQQVLDTTGGVLSNPLWDLSTGEQLRDSVGLPTNPTWAYSDAFVSESEERGKVSFLRSFRTFSTTLKDVVLIKEDSIH